MPTEEERNLVTPAPSPGREEEEVRKKIEALDQKIQNALASRDRDGEPQARERLEAAVDALREEV